MEENNNNNSVIFFIVVTVFVSALFLVLLMNSNKKMPKDVGTVSGTSLTDVVDQNEQEDTTAQLVEDVDELIIETLVEGSGPETVNGDGLVVHYKGTLLDGTQFDSSYDRGDPFSFTVGEGRVIQGWEEGMLGMKVGEKRKLTIPSRLGYGDYGQGSIPGGAALVFEVELLEIQ